MVACFDVDSSDWIRKLGQVDGENFLTNIIVVKFVVAQGYKDIECNEVSILNQDFLIDVNGFLVVSSQVVNTGKTQLILENVLQSLTLFHQMTFIAFLMSQMEIETSFQWTIWSNFWDCILSFIILTKEKVTARNVHPYIVNGYTDSILVLTWLWLSSLKQAHSSFNNAFPLLRSRICWILPPRKLVRVDDVLFVDFKCRLKVTGMEVTICQPKIVRYFGSFPCWLSKLLQRLQFSYMNRLITKTDHLKQSYCARVISLWQKIFKLGYLFWTSSRSWLDSFICWWSRFCPWQ